MTALVVGGSGLVGGALARALGRAGIGAAVTRFRGERDGAIELDVRDEVSVRACVRRVDPDLVFLAVNNPGGVDRCEDCPDEADALHVQGTRHVAEAAAERGATLVFYSTDYVFDGAAAPYAEEDRAHPLNHYGRAKLAAERIIHDLTPAHLIIRTTAVFGWARTSRNLAMQVWERLGSGGTMRVPQDQQCTPTLADYLAEVSVRLAGRGVRGVVHVVGGDRMVRSAMAKALAQAMDLDPGRIMPVPTAESGQRAPRPLGAVLRTDKMARLLGEAPLDFGESLRRFRRQWLADARA